MAGLDDARELLVITGMTGAGRSTPRRKELEDLGFYVVDNLPPQPAEGRSSPWWTTSRGPSEHVHDIAVVVDVRGRRVLRLAARPTWPDGAQRGRARHPAVPGGQRTRSLVRQASRRPGVRTRSRATAGCSTGSLQMERVVLGQPERRTADLVIDTSAPQRPSAHRPKIAEEFGDSPETDAAAGERGELRLQVRHPAWTPTSWPTCGSCPTRTGYPSCGPRPAATSAGQPSTSSGRTAPTQFLDTYVATLIVRCSPTDTLREGKRFATGGRRVHRRQAPLVSRCPRQLVATGCVPSAASDATGGAPGSGTGVTPVPREVAQSVVAFGGGHGLSCVAVRAAPPRRPTWSSTTSPLW